MAKKKKPKAQPIEQNSVGRPSDFKASYVQQAYKLCLLGATDIDMADFFGVCEKTINNWKSEFPEFLQSIKEGKEVADMHIASKLFNRAEGAKIKQQQAIKVKSTSYNDDGKKISEEEDVRVVTLEQEVPPDTTALIFWLKNRKSTQWRDRHEHELTGKDGAPLVPTINLTLGAQSKPSPETD